MKNIWSTMSNRYNISALFCPSRVRMKVHYVFLCSIALIVSASYNGFIQTSPYPPSVFIKGLKVDWATHQRYAKGSDNFQLTWAEDDHQYGIWGDGGGFAGTNSKYRVSFGVARIEGSYDNYKGYDLSGHAESAENESLIEGKSWALISIKGDLYAWIHPDRERGWGGWKEHHSESRLFKSTDKGVTWNAAEWKFTPENDIVGGAILQFGRDYQDARDKFVYHYFVHPDILVDSVKGISEIMKPGLIYLARVHGNKMMNRNAYQFLAGFKRGRPIWSRDENDKIPVFEDNNGVGTPMGISYNKGLDRFILTTGHTKGHSGMLGVFDAPDPWGPWSTISYATTDTWFGHNHNSHIVPPTTFFWCLPTKWMSEDGKSATIVFTGGWETGGPFNDSFNAVRVHFITP